MLRYIPSTMVRKPETAIFLKNNKATKNGNTSVVMNQKEHKKVRPREIARNLAFVFQFMVPFRIDRDIGEYLIHKHGAIVEVNYKGDPIDELNSLNKQQLMQKLGLYHNLAKERNLTRNVNFMVSNEKLVLQIRDYRKLGLFLQSEIDTVNS